MTTLTRADLEKYWDKAFDWLSEKHPEMLADKNWDAYLNGVMVAMKREDLGLKAKDKGLIF